MEMDNELGRRKGDKKSSKTQTIGDFLKKKRKEKNIELKSISLKTKINYTILRDLENNDYEKIPNKTYIRGFVKILAKEINANPEEAIQCLEETYKNIESKQKEKTKPHPKEGPNIYLNKTKKSLSAGKEKVRDITNNVKKKKNISIKHISLATAVVVLIATGHVIYKTNEKSQLLQSHQDLASNSQTKIEVHKENFTNPLQVQTQKPESRKLTATSANKTKVTPAQKDSSTKQTNKNQSTEKKKLNNVQEKDKLNAKKMAEKKEIFFRNIKKNLYALTKTSTNLTDSQVYPATIRNLSFNESNNKVYIAAKTGDTWVTYKSDNNQIKSFILKKDRNVLIRGSKILLFMGNINVAKIFFNDQEVLAESTKGIKSFVFPKKFIKEHQLPLFVFGEGGKILTGKEYKQTLVKKE